MKLSYLPIVTKRVTPPARYLPTISLYSYLAGFWTRTKYRHLPSRSDRSSQPLLVARASSFSSSTFDSSFSVAFIGGAGTTTGTVHRNLRPLSHRTWYDSPPILFSASEKSLLAVFGVDAEGLDESFSSASSSEMNVSGNCISYYLILLLKPRIVMLQSFT